MKTQPVTNVSVAALLLVWLISAAPTVYADPVTTIWGAWPPEKWDLVPRLLQAGGITVGDFNGDGTLDAAAPSACGGQLNVLLNRAPSLITWCSVGRWPTGLTAGDFDHDGHVDLAVVLQDEGGVAILTNDGTGVFTCTAFYATGLAPQAAVAVDLDKDGWLDLVVANRGAGTITVLGNTGGTFAVRQTISLSLAVDGAPAGVSCEPAALVAADLNNDGWQDVAVACAADDTAKVLTNTAGTLSLTGTYPAGPYPVGITAADLNGDGQMDLAVADREAPQVTVLLANRLTGYQPQDVFLVVVPYGPFEPPVGVAAVDVDADGKIDLLAAGATLHNDGNATFTVTPPQGPAPSTVYVTGTLAGDPGTFVATCLSGTVKLSYYPPAAVTPGNQPILADINADNAVNVSDLQLLVASWGKQQGQDGYDARADINGDHAVNIGDLQMLVSNWGSTR